MAGPTPALSQTLSWVSRYSAASVIKHVSLQWKSTGQHEGGPRFTLQLLLLLEERGLEFVLLTVTYTPEAGILRVTL